MTKVPHRNGFKNVFKNPSHTFLNRRRALDDKNGIQETSLSLLNYLALGLILFLIVLQLMLLLCPAQRKLFRNKLKSKWKKYRGKRPKKKDQLLPYESSTRSTDDSLSTESDKATKPNRLNKSIKPYKSSKSDYLPLNRKEKRNQSNFKSDDAKSTRHASGKPGVCSFSKQRNKSKKKRLEKVN